MAEAEAEAEVEAEITRLRKWIYFFSDPPPLKGLCLTTKMGSGACTAVPVALGNSSRDRTACMNAYRVPRGETVLQTRNSVWHLRLPPGMPRRDGGSVECAAVRSFSVPKYSRPTAAAGRRGCGAAEATTVTCTPQPRPTNTAATTAYSNSRARMMVRGCPALPSVGTPATRPVCGSLIRTACVHPSVHVLILHVATAHRRNCSSQATNRSRRQTRSL